MSQIFKQCVPTNVLFDYLNDTCDKNDSYYIFDNNAYKRGILEEKNQAFCDSIKDHYHNAKQYYVTRDMNYIKFCTILRQICKSNSIQFTTKIVYSQSKYHIPYHIYF